MRACMRIKQSTRVNFCICTKRTYHVVISKATMISSLRIRAVNEIDTIWRNSFSKRTRDMIMMAAPVINIMSVVDK